MSTSIFLQVMVSITNFQTYRHITSPGWTLGWEWTKKEIIWSMQGAEATDQGDCSTFRETMPHSCKRDPKVVDLLPYAPYDKQVANCCKGGVLTSWGQDPSSAVSVFQLIVGHSGSSNKTVKLPKNFTLFGPGLGYTCSPTKIAPASAFYSSDERRKTYALSKYHDCTKLNKHISMFYMYLHLHVLTFRERLRRGVGVSKPEVV